MAKRKGVYCGESGKIGNVVMQNWHGQQNIRTNVIPQNPRTAAQVAARNIMKSISQQFKVLKDTVVKYFWEPFAGRYKTGWANFTKYNRLAMSSGFDAGSAIMSRGSLEAIPSLAGVYNDSTGAIAVSWGSDAFVNGNATDEVSIVAVNNTDGTVLGIDIAAEARSAGNVSITVEGGLTATEIDIFAIASDTDPTTELPSMISDSVKATCTAVV